MEIKWKIQENDHLEHRTIWYINVKYFKKTEGNLSHPVAIRLIPEGWYFTFCQEMKIVSVVQLSIPVTGSFLG